MLNLARLPPESVRPLSRAEYEDMVARGMFEHERIELLGGVLVRMSPQNAPHSEIVDRLTEWLVPALLGRARVRIQGPFALSDDSEPEPDVGVYPPGVYGGAHPTRALLLIEVSDSSLDTDRGIKAALYAESGCPEYWIVNIRDRVVEIHTLPVSGEYTRVRTVGPSDTLAPTGFPGVGIAVGHLFPPPRP